MDTALLGLRVLLALACVLGLIWYTGRRVQGTAAVRKQRTVPLSVLGRQSLGKGSGVALVEVAGRVLLLGVGEQGVRVLTEVDVPVVPAAAPRAGEVREEIDLSTLPAVVAGAPDVAADVPAVADGEPAAADVAEAVEVGDLADAVSGPESTDGAEETNGTVDAEETDGTVDAEETDGTDGTEDADETDGAATDETGPDAVGGVPTPHADGTARLAALAGLAAGASSAQAGALRGSVLSPDTWRRTVDVVQRRTARR